MNPSHPCDVHDPAQRLIVALDVPTLDEASRYVDDVDIEAGLRINLAGIAATASESTIRQRARCPPTRNS